jgi:hypothetical protein
MRIRPKDADPDPQHRWQVWDNLMAIATDLAVFEDTLRSYNRILDLKQEQQEGGHVDSEVLAILVRVVTEGLPDSSGRLSSIITDCLRIRDRAVLSTEKMEFSTLC